MYCSPIRLTCSARRSELAVIINNAIHVWDGQTDQERVRFVHFLENLFDAEVEQTPGLLGLLKTITGVKNRYNLRDEFNFAFAVSAARDLSFCHAIRMFGTLQNLFRHARQATVTRYREYIANQQMQLMREREAKRAARVAAAAGDAKADGKSQPPKQKADTKQQQKPKAESKKAESKDGPEVTEPLTRMWWYIEQWLQCVELDKWHRLTDRYTAVATFDSPEKYIAKALLPNSTKKITQAALDEAMLARQLETLTDVRFRSPRSWRACACLPHARPCRCS